MARSKCSLCRAPLAPECEPCGRASQVYDKLLADNSTSDGDYVFHEVAHYVVLFRRRPQTRHDYSYLISDTISMFPLGVAQVHEMRTLALQFVTYEALGWKPDVARLVSLSWPGLRDVDTGLVEGVDRGRVIVETEKAARAYVRKLLPRTSVQNVRLYSRALRSMRGEVVSRS